MGFPPRPERRTFTDWNRGRRVGGKTGEDFIGSDSSNVAGGIVHGRSETAETKPPPGIPEGACASY
ncbi:MAG: hypothetical protein M9925_14905, partial [Chloroflexi bacterium]|nr:hypothetical protein [Chloroflexota bacterium]